MWSRQVARAAGASLIAPLVLLLAAGVVASGGGLGGLDSLGQIASGPSLPDTGLATASSSSLEGAEIVGAETPRSTTAPPSPAGGQELASANPPTAPPRAAGTASAAAETDLSRSGESPAGRPRSRPGDGTLLQKPDPAPPPAPDAVEDLQGTTEGLGESIGEPLRPLGNQLLDLRRLLTPPR